MRPPSGFHALPERMESNFSNDAVNLQQLVDSLETEICGLQKLVSYLLEKNERLRMRLHVCENTSQSLRLR